MQIISSAAYPLHCSFEADLLVDPISSTRHDDGCATHPELIGPELIYVGALSGYRLIPEAELQEKLIPARQQHLTPLLPVRREVLIMDRQINISLSF